MADEITEVPRRGRKAPRPVFDSAAAQQDTEPQPQPAAAETQANEDRFLDVTVACGLFCGGYLVIFVAFAAAFCHIDEKGYHTTKPARISNILALIFAFFAMVIMLCFIGAKNMRVTQANVDILKRDFKWGKPLLIMLEIGFIIFTAIILVDFGKESPEDKAKTLPLSVYVVLAPFILTIISLVYFWIMPRVLDRRLASVANPAASRQALN